MPEEGKATQGFRPAFAATAINYIVREFLLSFLLSFVFFFIIFFINQILLLAEDILSKSAPLGQTLLLLIYSLPAVVAIAFPFAALAGALMTSARLNADNEILAFSAAGISPRLLYVPFIAIGLVASALSFAANDYFLPRSAVAFQKLYGQMVATSASMELKPYSVIRYSKATIVTGKGEGDRAGDVLLFESSDGNTSGNVISADTARVTISESGNSAVIEMSKVLELANSETNLDEFSVSTADTVFYRFMLKDPIVGFSGTGPSEMSSRELLAAIRKKQTILDTRIAEATTKVYTSRERLIAEYGALLETTTDSKLQKDQGNELKRALSTAKQAEEAQPKDRSLGIYKLEYNKKFAIPAAGFFFSLLAFPLGLGTKRAGRTAGFGLALLLSTTYWGLLFAGQSAGLRINIDPALAMWAPNGMVFLAACFMWLQRKRGARRCI